MLTMNIRVKSSKSIFQRIRHNIVEILTPQVIKDIREIQEEYETEKEDRYGADRRLSYINGVEIVLNRQAVF